MHESFFERDYPPVEDLARVARALTDEFQPPELLAEKLRIMPEAFGRAAEKLASQGAAAFDMEGRVRSLLRSTDAGRWRPGYKAQLEHRRAQLQAMVAFAETAQCRMSALVRHFGDKPGVPCGRCDFCSPETAVAAPFGDPTAQQERQLRRIVRELQSGGPRSVGRLMTEAGVETDRRAFDALLDGLARAGLVTLAPETFTNAEGDEITFRKVAMTFEGRNLTEAEPLGVLLRPSPEETESLFSAPRKKKKSAQPKVDGPSRPAGRVEFTPAQADLEGRLRTWRRDEAARAGKPAFFVLSDAVLRSVVLESPRTLNDLTSISGIGPRKADLYGASILALCRAGEG
jgi:ATP-dependent DNA helicase RecQ